MDDMTLRQVEQIRQDAEDLAVKLQVLVRKTLGEANYYSRAVAAMDSARAAARIADGIAHTALITGDARREETTS